MTMKHKIYQKEEDRNWLIALVKEHIRWSPNQCFIQDKDGDKHFAPALVKRLRAYGIQKEVMGEMK